MAKKFNKLLIVIFVLAALCLCFSVTQFVPTNSASATAIEGASGNTFSMTGLVGYNPKHFFVNDNNESTLMHAKAQAGYEKYYSIVSSGWGKSSGWGELKLTPDMKPFVEKGILYAEASSLVSIANGSQMTLKISSGETSQQIVSSSGFLETPLLKIDDFNQNVRFYFETNSNDFSLDLPAIRLFTQIDSVTLDEKDQNVNQGQLVVINAHNAVTDISGTAGNFMNFSKINHEIQYEFVSGRNNVEIVGSNLKIKNTAPNGSQIKFRVYCNKNSYSTEKIYSANYVTLTVDTTRVNVKVRTDFDEISSFVGEGQYENGRRFSLTAKTQKGFEFVGWYVDGVFKTSNTKLTTTATFGQDIYAKYKKSIQIQSVQVRSRCYDGTTNISDDEVVVVFSGVKDGHEISLVGVKFSYYDADAGKNKYVNASFETLSLAGKDADKYSLTTVALPQIYGEVYKRDATVILQNATKEYGDNDPVLPYGTQNVVGNLAGTLSRQLGEEIGTYKILEGDLVAKNPNYNITFEGSGVLEIVQRTLTLTNVAVEEKIYDTTCDATITATLSNIHKNEDVKVRIFGEFVSANVGNNVEVRITKTELYGTDAKNYVLQDYTQKIYGQISPKSITVTAKNSESVYGDEIKFDFVVDGLLEGSLQNLIFVDNTNVGEHEIQLAPLTNPNYVIGKFVSATHTIKPREVVVKADAKSKIYGDEDVPLSYKTQNLVMGDTLLGELVRKSGEDAGKYAILQGSLSNPNYTIKFESNTFEILPRTIGVNISFLNKVYDGTTDVKFEVSYENNIKNEVFECELSVQLADKNSGNSNVVISEKNVSCENIQNYLFEYNFLNTQIEVAKREISIFVSNASKIYGEDDPEFSYIARNMLENEQLGLHVGRRSGENVGQYSFYFMLADNRNYNITFASQKFEILPREMRVSVENQSKVFGDADPTIAYTLLDDLCYNDTAESIFDGQIGRSAGENVGVYAYDLSELSTSANYKFVNALSTNFIITKRPIFVSIANAQKVYGDDDPVFEYSVSNDIEGQRFQASISREYGEDVGKYNLVCSILNDPRYIVDFSAGTLEITPFEICVKADEKAKIYGEEDPVLTTSITQGYLRLNDRLENIISGSLVREEGENVGSYQINLGTLSYGENYRISFESGEMKILQRYIKIIAVEQSKTYGEVDPSFEFTIGGDGLVFGDKIEGSLSRSEGENVDFYDILQGDIHTNSNYYFDFVSAKFEILKKKIQIVPTTLSKQYGDEDVEIEYEVLGELVGSDTLSGKLYRDTSKNQIGRYQIFSTLSNPNYEISLAINYFTILPRDIVIEADSFQINYGESEPELTYRIISGNILDGDVLSGDIYRTNGNSAGTYDILSRLSISKNYNIIFIKGTLEILPLDISIRSENYQKIYGQSDPTFSYEIVSGELLNGDQLYGTLLRENGEDVGTYNLINGIYNANYNITLLPAQLEIVKKSVKLVTGVYDKIFDGTTKAYLKNPYISGVLDDVFLEYDREECAEFESSEVGNHIAVHIRNISMSGEKAGNYTLILPEVLYANITLPELEKEEVKITANDASIQGNYNLNYSSHNVEKAQSVQNHKFVYVYNIWMENNDEKVNSQSLFTIKVSVPEQIFNKDNVFVYQKDKNGNFVRVASQKGENGEIIITDAQLGELYIAIEDETWLDIGMFVALIVIGLVGILCGVSIILKRRKKIKLI